MTVSSLGDAKSLRGGTLLLTQLRAADNEVYALAQGNLVVGGLAPAGKSGSSVTVNTPTGGRIPNGATDRARDPDRFRHPPGRAAAPAPPELRHRDQRGATRSTAASARSPPRPTAPASRSWRPANPTERVAFVAKLENMPVEAGAEVPKVVFN